MQTIGIHHVSNITVHVSRSNNNATTLRLQTGACPHTGFTELTAFGLTDELVERLEGALDPTYPERAPAPCIVEEAA